MPRGSLLLRTVCPRTKKRGTKAKLPQSQNNTKVTVVVPLRRSARRAKIVQVQEKNANKKVGRPRRNLLVLSGELDATIDSPKCSLCSELESTPTVNYIACELCGGIRYGSSFLYFKFQECSCLCYYTYDQKWGG
nr:DDT domain-containing protein PTM [Ipomoea batatas]